MIYMTLLHIMGVRGVFFMLIGWVPLGASPIGPQLREGNMGNLPPPTIEVSCL
jgi:hypothetical protein